MTKIIEFIKSEPVLIGAFFAQAITLAVSFGLGLTEGQILGLNGFVAAVLSVIVRSKVTPVR